MRTSSLYILIGVEPVARPSTHFAPAFCFSFISFAISDATYREPSFGFEKISHGIFSKESTMLLMLFLFFYKFDFKNSD
jgi:hypothetical protein